MLFLRLILSYLTPLRVVCLTLFSVFGYPYEKLSLVFDILRKFQFIHLLKIQFFRLRKVYFEIVMVNALNDHGGSTLSYLIFGIIFCWSIQSVVSGKLSCKISHVVKRRYPWNVFSFLFKIWRETQGHFIWQHAAPKKTLHQISQCSQIKCTVPLGFHN